jgi:hypothetical protein
MDAARLEDHKKILGILYVITAMLTIMAMLVLHAILSTVFAFAFAEADPDEQAVFQLVMAIARYVQVIVITIVAVPTLIAGAGLLARQSWAMIVALVVACFKLFSFPVGTAIGVYAIWIYSEDQKLKQASRTT